MELKQAILERKSIRGYQDKPVPKEVIRDVLRLATRAVSGVNCQPWEFAVVTGELLDNIREENMNALHAQTPPDRIDPEVPPGIYTDRSKTIGKALLTAMEISREDKERRNWWMERGYRFFDAPVLIILLMDNALEEAAYRFDMGCVAQNICLAAMEYGLGTCVADQSITYQAGFRKYLQIPVEKRYVCGIALGYPDAAFKANGVVSPREDVDAVTTWYGF